MAPPVIAETYPSVNPMSEAVPSTRGRTTRERRESFVAAGVKKTTGTMEDRSEILRNGKTVVTTVETTGVTTGLTIVADAAIKEVAAVATITTTITTTITVTTTGMEAEGVTEVEAEEAVVEEGLEEVGMDRDKVVAGLTTITTTPTAQNAIVVKMVVVTAIEITRTKGHMRISVTVQETTTIVIE